MKVAHLDNTEKTALSFAECVAIAKVLEAAGKPDEAIKTYQQCVKLRPANEYPYNRLMILYRKKKEYKKELATIDVAIKAFEKLYLHSGKNVNKKVSLLSKSLMKSTGLSDKKGNILLDQKPISTWKKRAALLKKRHAV